MSEAIRIEWNSESTVQGKKDILDYTIVLITFFTQTSTVVYSKLIPVPMLPWEPLPPTKENWSSQVQFQYRGVPKMEHACSDAKRSCTSGSTDV